MFALYDSGIPRMQISTTLHEDRLISSLIYKYGHIAEYIAIKLQGYILSQGHYVIWDEHTAAYMARITGTTIELVCQVVETMVDYGIFDRSLYDEGVLTGIELQKLFYEVTRRRKDSAERNKHRIYYDDKPSDKESDADDDCSTTVVQSHSKCTARRSSCRQSKVRSRSTSRSTSKKQSNATCQETSGGGGCTTDVNNDPSRRRRKTLGEIDGSDSLDSMSPEKPAALRTEHGWRRKNASGRRKNLVEAGGAGVMKRSFSEAGISRVCDDPGAATMFSAPHLRMTG